MREYATMLERLEEDGSWRSIYNLEWRKPDVPSNSRDYFSKQGLELPRYLRTIYGRNNPAIRFIKSCPTTNTGMPIDCDSRIMSAYVHTNGFPDLCHCTIVKDFMDYMNTLRVHIALGMECPLQSYQEYERIMFPLSEALKNYDLEYDTFRLIIWLEK